MDPLLESLPVTNLSVVRKRPCGMIYIIRTLKVSALRRILAAIS
jgi:hypothetical protein